MGLERDRNLAGSSHTGDGPLPLRASSSSRPGDVVPAAAVSQTLPVEPRAVVYEACSSSCSPFPAPVISRHDLAGADSRDLLLVELSRLMASSATGWGEYWTLFCDNAWCREVWHDVASSAAGRNPALHASADDIAQAAILSLGKLLRRKANLFLWLGKPGARFPQWFRGLARRLCSVAVRTLRRQALGGGKLRRCTLSAGELASVADHRRSETERAVADEHVQARLAAFPQRTRDVVQLRADGATWQETALRLGITVKAAKYAYQLWNEDMRNALGDA